MGLTANDIPLTHRGRVLFVYIVNGSWGWHLANGATPVGVVQSDREEGAKSGLQPGRPNNPGSSERRLPRSAEGLKRPWEQKLANDRAPAWWGAKQQTHWRTN
jgi:hypothetical protein